MSVISLLPNADDGMGRAWVDMNASSLFAWKKQGARNSNFVVGSHPDPPQDCCSAPTVSLDKDIP